MCQDQRERNAMMTYRKFLSFLVPGFNMPAVKLLLIMISLAFYAVSLDVMNSLVMIIKRRVESSDE
jgi:hypothetical protein